MLKRDKWRLIVVVAVIVIAAVVAFPIKGKMRLGLDLSGGVHIVLQAKGTPESPLTPDQHRQASRRPAFENRPVRNS